MPNWCEGSMRIRGKNKDIFNFLINEIIAVAGTHGEEERSIKEAGTFFSEYDSGNVFIDFCSKGRYSLWLRNSRRFFIEDGEIEFNPEEEKITSCAFDIKQAWNIEVMPFVSISKKYNLDINITGFESGQQFQREISIRDGFSIRDETINYDDWNFECQCPNLGG